MKNSVFIFFILFLTEAFSQFTIIPTGTSSTISEIDQQGDFIIVNGSYGFLAKCYGDCDYLINLNAPGWSGYMNDNLNLVDTNNIYLVSYTTFPHHGFVFKSEDVGLSWIELLDTADILFTDFFMFDTSHATIITTSYNSLVTSDEGETWLHDNHGLGYCSASLKVNDSTAILGTTEHLSISTDKGLTWSGSGFVQSPPRAFFAENLDSIYAITYGVTGVFFSHSFNGPNNWIDRAIPDLDPMNLAVRSLDEVYVVGECISTGTARIMKTTNLGLTWSFYDTGIDGMFFDIEFVNDSIALIGGTNGLLIKWNSNSHFEVLGLNDKLNQNNAPLGVFPNPVQNEINFSGVEIENSDVIIYSLDGKEILRKKIVDENKIDVSELATGNYILKVITETGVYSVQILKE